LLFALIASVAALELIKDSYIVVVDKSCDDVSFDKMQTVYGAERVYNMDGFKGFSATLNTEQLSECQNNGFVRYVEQNQVVRTSFAEQRNPTWGLDRVDQTRLPLDNVFRYYDNAGAGVNSYIVDTGIRMGHRDFEGRAVSGYDFHNGNANAEDDNGHGTHVAGTVGGGEWGLAKNCTLIGVKVLGAFGAGSTANVVAGVNYVATSHRAGDRSTANLSLGGGASAAMDDAANAAVRAGVSMIVASGNSNENACNSSPARAGGPSGIVVTVNAADRNDARATFSNFGTCTDIFAPGVSITSAWHTSDTATNTISGTSMASPHVCGAATLMLGESDMSPAAVKAALMADAPRNVISNPGTGSTNANLFSKYQ
jgi:subtilisin family serine protease